MPSTLRRLGDGVALTPIQYSQLSGEGPRQRQTPMLVETADESRDKVNEVQPSVPMLRNPN